MKKILKSRLFTFILGLVIAGSIGVYAVNVSSSEVSYDNTNSGSEATTVEGAIDDLYSKVENNTSNVCAGIKQVELGTATSYNIKSLYPGLYDKLTNDNFYYRMGGSSTSIPANCDGECFDRSSATYTQPNVTYNQETGILTCGNGSLTGTTMWGGVSNPRGSATVTLTTTCYMSISNVIELGSNTSYDIKTLYPNKYAQLTNDNFYMKAASNSVTATRNCDGECVDRGNATFSLSQPSYNATTGILTCNNGTLSVYNLWGGMSNQRGSASKAVTTTCYLVMN